MVKKFFVTLNVKTKETFDFVYFAKFLSTSTSCAYLSGISCSMILLCYIPTKMFRPIANRISAAILGPRFISDGNLD